MPCLIQFLTVADRSGASARYRAYQFEGILRANGFSADFTSPKPLRRRRPRFLERFREESGILETVRTADLVFIQKRLFSTRFLRRLRKMNKPVIFDFDDAIFTDPRSTRSRWATARVTRRLHATMKTADLVLAGNQYLADYARGAGARVEILPTAVDMSRYPEKKHHDRREVTLGWIGSRATESYLDALREILPGVASLLPDFRLRFLIISDGNYETKGAEVIHRTWTEETEIKDLLEIDIGLMPLPQDSWTRGKCGLKAIQYMAAGIPAVCSAVGANRTIVSNGETGFLCHTESDWIDTLRVLIEEPALRNDLGKAGREHVAETYSTAVVGKKLASLLKSLSPNTH